MNKENLKKLADYLDALPDDYEQFDMGTFMSEDDGVFVEGLNPERCDFAGQSPACGTVACAVGHAPYAGLPKPKDGEYWERYSERIFDTNYHSDEWEFMFSCEWRDYQPTASQAARRIRYVVETGSFHPAFIDADGGCDFEAYDKAIREAE